MHDLKLGDIVKLIGIDSPEMRVIELEGQKISCAWFTKSMQLQYFSLPRDSLALVKGDDEVDATPIPLRKRTG
jgi:hypothetical protein